MRRRSAHRPQRQRHRAQVRRRGGVSAVAVRQHSIAIDAHSSECFTASTATCQAVAYRGILAELRMSQEVPTPIYSDSRSTLLVAQNSAALRKSIFILRRIQVRQQARFHGSAPVLDGGVSA
mmetsp:Transcript_38610/g.67835  ORF Transcript_38610/g.67835 Transcript_38610/m.67835 type:complete len:122 (-) Transcript_38610:10-375(-)